MIEILIPTKNGMPYLQAAVESAIEQEEEFRLTISNDHSMDGSAEYLETVTDDRVSLVSPPHPMSMSEHWDWLISQSTGDWLMVLGQDDLLMPHFFRYAEVLCRRAEDSELRVIRARRAFYFWEGVDMAYGERAAFAEGRRIEKVRKIGYETAAALANIRSYHQMPQMYTSSLFHKDLIEEVKQSNNGRVINCHPQDANLAAIAARYEKRYLATDLPFSWVGTSARSAGLQVALNAEDKLAPSDEMSKFARSYQDSVLDDERIQYPSWAGRFGLAENSIYFWQALIVTGAHRRRWFDQFLARRYLLYALVILVIGRSGIDGISGTKRTEIEHLLACNAIKPAMAFRLGGTMTSVFRWGLRIRELFRHRHASARATSELDMSIKFLRDDLPSLGTLQRKAEEAYLQSAGVARR